MKRRLCILASSIALGLLAAGCDQAHGQAATSSAPITIGAAVSETGTYAIDGKSTRRGYDMWADAVNARGGINVGGEKRKVKVVYYDDESDPETAVKLVQRLISEDK